MWSEDGRMEVLGRCRVCLSRSRALHRLAGTPLEETYERVTRETLVVAGRPCCVCSVCLAALRRSSRFLEAAHQANQALDRWSQSSATCVLTEQPLYPFVRSPVKTVDYPSDDVGDTKVKREIGTPDITQTTGNNTESYFEVQLENTPHVEKTFAKDIKYENNTNDTSTNVPSHSMYVQEYDSNVNDSSTDYGNTTDYVEAILDEPVACSSKTEKKASRTMNTRKRTKNDDVTSAPALNKRRPITTKRPGTAATKKKKKIDTFSCLECEYKTTKKWHLQEHIIIHTGEKPFMCDKCAFKCGRKSELQKHLARHTGDKPFKCDECDYKCSIKADLKRHQKKHTGEKPFACNQCDYRSSYKSNLKQHQVKHNSDKQYTCHYCDYRSTHERLVKQHLLTHTGEKPFACDKCDYKCSRKGSLKQHLMIHTGDKKFSCNKCDFKAYLKNSLKMHLMIHTGEKPFMCDKCDYKSCRKGELNRHLKIHSGENRFKCDVCDYESRDRRALKRHLKRHVNY